MVWHHFQHGEHYSLAEVVSTCDARIRDGVVLAPKEKSKLVREMEKGARATIVWSPLSLKGWGASPFNPNCWRTIEGKAIISGSVPDLLGDESV